MTTESTRPGRSRRRPPRPSAALERKLDSVLEAFKKMMPSLFFRPSVNRLLRGAENYVEGATYDTGEEVLDVKFVPQEQVGAVPALHARWQKSGVTKDLEEAEAVELREAGFRVFSDDTGADYAYYREKQVENCWICLCQTGWRYTRSKSLKAVKEWKKASSVFEPRLPDLSGCERTHRAVLKDSLIEALVVFEYELPAKVVSHPAFVPTLILLWEDAILHLEDKQPIQAITSN